ncbi:MAG: bifunctional adenosylcobinamide kinase/adenosylcobinamide-phosphate guanylyltransferase [Clostridiales bacterium]|nr:bifunctional adenosylcobinamide kinase/adenosylcobinamide-phosphate guanylyltransferase [Clostridiales bacterium]
MLILVTGGSGSGKSEYAQRRCMELDAGPKLYIATMEVYDEESRRRVERHQAIRDGMGFETVECQRHLEQAKIVPGQVVLLECVSNLAANEMFSGGETRKPDQVADTVVRGVEHLLQIASHVVAVTNQVFSDGITYDAQTEDYRRCLAQINNRLAAMADETVEVVCGIPLLLRQRQQP